MNAKEKKFIHKKTRKLNFSQAYGYEIKNFNFSVYDYEFLLLNEQTDKKKIPKTFNLPSLECTFLREIKSDIEKVVLWLCKFKFSDIKFIAVVCRGTKGLKAWLENGDIFPLNQKIMDGFFDGFLSIRKEVYQWIDFFSRKFKITKLVFTGFSRGGATCQILRYFSSRILGIGARTVYTVTFASPRVFQDGEGRLKNKANVSASEYNQLDIEETARTLHYTQINDPICALPPTILGYRRTGKRIFIGLKNKFLSKIPILRLFLFHPISRYKKDLKTLEC